MQHDVLTTRLNRAVVPLALACAVAAAVAVPASAEDDLTSLSYIAYVERYATVQTATQEETLEAVMNMPLVPGDRVDTARQARVELRLSDGSSVWLDQYTALALDAVAYSRGTDDPRTVLFLADGSAIVAIPSSSLVEEPTRVDGPGATVYLNGPGWFRLETLRSNTTRVEVWEGSADVLTGTGTVQVRTGSSAEIADHQVVRTEAYLTRGDDFGRWVMDRVQPTEEGSSTRHVGQRYARQGAVLDNYGSWIYIDSRDLWAWRPAVAATWRPYTHGRWYWTHTGWSWISYEPWGWLPHHYGTWFFDASHGGWLWLWGDYWGPAWVNWMWWDGWVGWCPRGWYDYWYWDHWRRPWRDGWHPSGPRPPRSSTMPPAGAGRDSRDPVRTTRGGDEGRPTPGRLALDISGSARLDQMDTRGWNVVPASDFGDSHLARRVRPAGEVLASAPGDARAVVASGPLLTEPPQAGSAAREVERAFRQVDRSNDLSPLLARNDELDATAIAAAARPVDTATLARRTQAPVSREVTRLEGAPGSTSIERRADTVRPGISTRPETDRAPANIHRPLGRDTLTDRTPLTAPSTPRTGTLLGGDAFGRSGAQPRSISPPSGSDQRSPVIPRSGGRIVPPTSGSVTAPGVRSVTPPSSSRSPSVAPRPVLRPSSPSLRAPSSRGPSSSTIQRPSSSSSRPSVRPRSSSSSTPPPSVRPRSSGSSSRPSVAPRSSSSSSSSSRSVRPAPRSSSSSSSAKPSRPRE